MTQRVSRNAPFGPAQLVHDFLDATLDGGAVHRQLGRGRLLVIAPLARKDPLGIAMRGPVATQHVERPGRERHESVFVSFASTDVDQHPPGVDVRDLEMECLLQAETQGIDSPEEALHGWLADAVDELIDLWNRQDGGELGLFGNAQLGECGPLSRAGAGVEELETGVGDLEGVAFALLVVLDEQQVASEIILGGQIGRLVEPLSELSDGAEVGLVGSVRQPGQLHVVKHLLGEG